jgi:cold shock CspA family protein/ribosome-associated translation inhibitor RaiA
MPMQLSSKISFHGVEPSEFVEARVRERIERLSSRASDRIDRCDVVIEAPHHRKHKGDLYTVRIKMHALGQDLIVDRAGPQDHSHEDVYVALRDAFDAAERRLDDCTRKREKTVKAHEVPPHGKVVRIFTQEGYGFVETSDAIEVYFHENSVVGSPFADLTIGDEVRVEMAVGESDKGPQATTVRLIGKHHLVS